MSRRRRVFPKRLNVVQKLQQSNVRIRIPMMKFSEYRSAIDIIASQAPLSFMPSSLVTSHASKQCCGNAIGCVTTAAGNCTDQKDTARSTSSNAFQSLVDTDRHEKHLSIASATQVVKPVILYIGCLLLCLWVAQTDAQLSFSRDLMNSRFLNYGSDSKISIYVCYNVSENATKDTLVTTVYGDSSNRMNSIYYRINRGTDPKRQFAVTPDGNVLVANALDREEIPTYHLSIEAFDRAGEVDNVLLRILVIDVNDNAPVPYTVPETCIFMEHVPPENLPSCEIRAFDPDTDDNGPPFKMEVSSSFQYNDYINLRFNQNGADGNGSMIVTPLREFDREQEPGKYLEIPLILSDKKGLSKEHSVFIIIGDINDSDMSDGVANIQVFSYLGRTDRTVIGRVYVEDRDDWDIGSKTFVWGPEGEVNGFSLAQNGEITMEANMAPGKYVLTSSVTDHERQQHAVGTVYVEVIEVPQEAFDNQGILRILYGRPGGYLSPDVFLRPDNQGTSPLTRFCNKMSEYLENDPIVRVFSIQPGEANLQASTLKVIDVRFTAQGSSSYVSSVVLDGLIMQHRSELEEIIGAKIVSGGNDMCKFTKCDYGCHTVHNANGAGYLVSANQTVILGVNAWSNDSCKCPVFEPPSSCRAGLCRNGGVCHNTYPNGFFCECRDSGLKGFRCEGTTRSFNGAGYAWFKPIPACTSLNISLQFMTSELDGLLLYNGPFGSNISASHLDYFDYLSIRLSSGRIEAEYAFNGINRNILQVPSTSELNDGRWHTVTFTQIGKKVELVLDNYALGDEYPVSVNSSCRVLATTADDDERLNMNTPLQIGGLAPISSPDNYPDVVTSKTQYFNGCIRDLIVNGEKYDLGVPELTDGQNTSPGCSMNIAACGIDNSYCQHGECVADASSNVPKCICDPGYSGVQCDLELEWVEFGPGAFIEYNVAVFLEEKRSDIDVLVYPGQRGTGTLGYGKDVNKYVGTYLSNYSVGGFFDCGESLSNSSLDLRMDKLQMNNNYSYWVQFSRNPTRATLTVDGTYYLSEQLDPVKRPFKINIKELLLGARSTSRATDFQGCIGTFRWEHQNLPLLQNASSQPSQTTSTADLIYVRNSAGVTRGCSMRPTCAMTICNPPFVCVDFWKGPFCTCPTKLLPVLAADGTVLRCGEVVAYSKLGISNNAIIIIMVFLGLLLMMALLMIVYSRRQTPPFVPVRPVELNRDNIRPYDIEGGGEADNDQYDINGLRKPVMPLESSGLGGYPLQATAPQRTVPEDTVSAQIRIMDADPDATAPYDELHIYKDEGNDRSILSLESLDSADYGLPAGSIDELNIGEWGEPFKEIARIYGKRE